MLVSVPSSVLADNGNQLDAMVIPNKIIANSDGIIQVVPKDFNNAIENLVATSSDSSIIQVTNVTQDVSHNAYEIKINAGNAGLATNSIAASGLAPHELPVTVYQDSKTPTNLLIKATPKIFSTSGPDAGYISVETINQDGTPSPVQSDTVISLSVSDNTVAALASDQMIIKQGSYFTTEKFLMEKPGSVTIYASASSMQPVSDSITMNNEAVPYTIQAYAYPPIINVD